MGGHGSGGAPPNSELMSAARAAVNMDLYNASLILLLGVFAATWLMQCVSFARRQKLSDSSEALVSDTSGGLSNSSASAPLQKGGVYAERGKRSEFLSFQRWFLLTYILMATADWLQGAYVYRLYSYYGFSRAENGYLFIAGYGSSLVIGTWVGPLADRGGRRLCCVLYGISYIIACWTKFYNNYAILMLGRVISGVSTSILCSGFESWMASEHQSRGFDPRWIGETFSHMCTLNGLAAIASGIVAEYAVALYGGHPVAPFGLAAVFLAVGTLLIMLQWRENYGGDCPNNEADEGGEQQQRRSSKRSFFWGVVGPLASAGRLVLFDPQIRLVGLLQSLYEGCMYTFVFMWSPALEQAAVVALEKLHPTESDGGSAALGVIAGTIPYGIVFASFMLGSSLGGTLFGAMTGGSDSQPETAASNDEVGHYKVAVDAKNNKTSSPHFRGRPRAAVGGEAVAPSALNSSSPHVFRTPFGPLSAARLFQILFVVSTAAFAVPAFSSSQTALFTSFVVFEVCVGIFWPMLGVIRSQHLPEAQRATIINIFRVPLNAIVVGVLFFQGSMGVGTVFSVCAALLLLGAFLSTRLQAA